MIGYIVFVHPALRVIVYVVTNKCEVVCLDIEGFKNGNDGPFMDEANYVKPKGTQDS